jgi:hypothetical protein
MQDSGVELHETTFVVCFLSARGAPRIATFRLAGDGLAAERRQRRADDEGAVEVGQNTPYCREQIQARGKRVV